MKSTHVTYIVVVCILHSYLLVLFSLFGCWNLHDWSQFGPHGLALVTAGWVTHYVEGLITSRIRSVREGNVFRLFICPPGRGVPPVLSPDRTRGQDQTRGTPYLRQDQTRGYPSLGHDQTRWYPLPSPRQDQTREYSLILDRTRPEGTLSPPPPRVWFATPRAVRLLQSRRRTF